MKIKTTQLTTTVVEKEIELPAYFHEPIQNKFMIILSEDKALRLQYYTSLKAFSIDPCSPDSHCSGEQITRDEFASKIADAHDTANELIELFNQAVVEATK